MNQFPRKILLVVDGSYQAFETVKYASGVLPPDGTAIALLHIRSKVPEAFWDLEKDPVWQHKVQTVRGWEAQQEEKINDFIGRALQVFLDAGFPDTAIKVDVRDRIEGIARDIGMESHRGYDSVVLGRRGLSTIKELSLGGVAAKIVIKASDVAVCLIGGRPDTEKIIVGMDSSEGCARAVDHLCKTIGAPGKKVLLCHVVRRITSEEGLDDSAFEEFQQERMEKAARDIGPVFEKAAKELEAAGLATGDIAVKSIMGATSRSAAILDQAKEGGYGTIVVGRRGVSRVEGFDMGRVTNKLIQTAKDKALWIVG
ncbi:MAG: universal stress protein [Syntrophobacteraceae bacterium]